MNWVTMFFTVILRRTTDTEFVLFNMINHTDYEANALRGHVLLDDDRVYSLAREGYDVVQMARTMGSNVNLMLIKMQGNEQTRI